MKCTRAECAKQANPLQLYLREIEEGALLSAAEESALAEAIARGDDDARARMIRANLRLVVKIARDYVGRGLVLEDLIGEGNVGLIRAAEEFKPRYGTRFSTYASYWIKQSIRHALINTSATIRLPAHMVGLLTKWRRAERAFFRERKTLPNFGDVAKLLGLSETQKSLVTRAQQARQLKLESSMTAESGRWPPADSYSRYESPGASLEADDERRILRDRMARLDIRERMILALRYGLEGESPLTLTEIGRRLGITREWVRKLELRALRKLDPERESRAGAGSGGRAPAPSSWPLRRPVPRLAAPAFAPTGSESRVPYHSGLDVSQKQHSFSPHRPWRAPGRSAWQQPARAMSKTAGSGCGSGGREP
jgi:RNA polymerase primary sigma factor